MGIQKKLIYTGLIFSSLVLVYFLFSTGDTKSKKKKMKSEDLSFLLGGSPSGRPGDGGKNPMGVRGEDSKSIFDSDFYSSGKLSYEDKDSSKTQVTEQGEIPINPQTGKPYPAEAMEQFDRLRELFPGNDLIPKRLDPATKAQQEATNQRLADASRNVMSGNSSRDDLDFYYGTMEKQVSDRLQIIEYLIEVQGGEDEEMDKKFKQVLDSVQAQRNQVQSEREAAYKRSGF